MRVRLPRALLRAGGPSPKEIFDFQPGPSWVMATAKEVLIDGDQLRLYAGWMDREAWLGVADLIEHGRVVASDDFVAVLVAVDLPIPEALLRFLASGDIREGPGKQ